MCYNRGVHGADDSAFFEDELAAHFANASINGLVDHVQVFHHVLDRDVAAHAQDAVRGAELVLRDLGALAVFIPQRRAS